MYLLYVDESGTAHDRNGQFFVLAGFSIFERQAHWLDSQIAHIASRFESYFGEHGCELHASPMFSGSDGWRQAATVPQRVQAVVDVLSLLNNKQTSVRIIASVIETTQITDKHNIIPMAFQDIAFTFDHSLRNIYSKYKNPQRGIMIFDKSSSERMIQELSHAAKHIGRGNDKLRNFAEVPVFVDSKASRLIQLADMIAYWIYRYYTAKDNRGFKLIEPYFLRDGARKIGLIEHISPETQLAILSAHDQGHPFPEPSK